MKVQEQSKSQNISNDNYYHINNYNDQNILQQIFKNKFILLLLVFWVVVSAVFVIHPAREFVTGWAESKLSGPPQAQRSILGVLQTELTKSGPKVTVTKVKTKSEISLEIYFLRDNTNEPTEVKRIILDDRRDAYFDMKGQVANLAAADIDDDSNLEIFAPTFDENLIPSMNIFKFDSTTNDFEKLDYRTYPL